MKPNKTAKVAERVDAKFAQRLQTVADKVGVPKAQLVRCALLAVVEHAERNLYSLSFPLRISSGPAPMPAKLSDEEHFTKYMTRHIKSRLLAGFDGGDKITTPEEFQARVAELLAQAVEDSRQTTARRQFLLGYTNPPGTPPSDLPPTQNTPSA